MTTLADVRPHLKKYRKVGDGGIALCPFHDDHNPSLSIKEENGKLLAYCHGPCGDVFERLIATLPHNNGGSRRIVATYDYRDETGSLQYQAVRREDKSFFLRRPDGHGDWINNLNGNRRVLLNLPEIIAARPTQTIAICEGEKDCNALMARGVVATTNVGGAGKWRDEYSEVFHDRNVAILPDNDDPGKAHALQVATSLHAHGAKSIKIVELAGLPEKGDVSDWLDAGHTLRELRELVKNAPEFVGPQAQTREKIQTKGLTLKSIAEFLAEPDDQRPGVIDKLLPRGGVSALCSKPKNGKTTTAINISVAVANGAEFVGRKANQGTVLFIQFEGITDETRSAFRLLGATENIFIYVGPAPIDPVSEIRALVDQYEPALVVIDTLAHALRIKDFNSYGDVMLALSPLMEMARTAKSQPHILFLHHNGKGADLRDGGDAVLGSTAIFGAVDTLLTMRVRAGVHTIESTQRYGLNLPETILTLNKETGAIESSGSMADHILNERKASVLEAVGPEPQTEAQIKDCVPGTNKGLTSKAVRALYEEGKLIRTGAGKKGNPFLYAQPASAELALR